MIPTRRAALLLLSLSGFFTGCACGGAGVAFPALQIVLRDDQSGAAINGATVTLMPMGPSQTYSAPAAQGNGFYTVQ